LSQDDWRHGFSCLGLSSFSTLLCLVLAVFGTSMSHCGSVVSCVQTFNWLSTTGLTTCLTTGCIVYTAGWLFVYTIQPVDNRLYRVNGVSVSCLILSQSNPKCLGSSDAENDYQLVYVVCTVRMFKCSAMASNCGGCRRTDAIYHCGWDVANNRCCAFNECSGPSWLSAGDICTNPALFSVRLVVTDCVHESNCSVNMHVYVIFQVFYVRYRHIPVFQVNLVRQLPC